VPHIQGIQRDAVLLFPSSLDEYITDDNPVRFIDAFVDELDLHDLGFLRALPNPMGRPAYAPGDLLKLYIYGYLNRIRSSRLLERESQRNIEVIWLLKKLTPDFKTIADFRKNNLRAIKDVCRCFTLLCKELDLFGGELVAIDGCKFKAVNNYTRNFTDKRFERVLRELDEAIAGYLQELQNQDAQEQALPPVVKDLQIRIERLRTRKAEYERLRHQLQQSTETQLSLTDPDSRAMVTARGTVVGYNVQFTTDAKHKLIVDHEVTNDVTDQNQLAAMALRAKEVFGVERLDALADSGFYDGEQIKACIDAGITPWVPKPHTSRNQQQGLFTKDDFSYLADQDSYRCPSGAELTYRFSTVEDGRPQRYYASPACGSCPIRAQCTRSQKNGRRITRWEHEGLLDAMAERIRSDRAFMRRRKTIVEHPFGTMKRGMQQGDFLLRGLGKVAGEMSLTVLTYNLKRVLTLLGVPKLLAALREGRLEQAVQQLDRAGTQHLYWKCLYDCMKRAIRCGIRGQVLNQAQWPIKAPATFHTVSAWSRRRFAAPRSVAF